MLIFIILWVINFFGPFTKILPGESIVDYLGICFAINAGFSWKQVREWLALKFKDSFDKIKAEVITELEGRKIPSEGIQEKLTKLDLAYDTSIDQCSKHIRNITYLGMTATLIAVICNGYSWVKDAHIFNLLYLSPLCLYFFCLFYHWSEGKTKLKEIVKPIQELCDAENKSKSALNELGVNAENIIITFQSNK